MNHLSAPELGLMARREQEVYDRAAPIFTFSDYLRESFLKDFGLPSQRVETVYAGANLDLTRILPRSSVPEGPPTILFVGRQWE